MKKLQKIGSSETTRAACLKNNKTKFLFFSTDFSNKNIMQISSKSQSFFNKKFSNYISQLKYNKQNKFSKKHFSINTKIPRKNIEYKTHFFSWLAGLIDGVGLFSISTKNYTSCEITVSLREINILAKIKKNLGGSIILRKNAAAYRWRLHNKNGMRTLVKNINGKLLLQSKQIQLKKVCENLNIQHSCFEFNSNTYWLTGFFEAEGYLNVNSNNLQCSIILSQKTPEILEKIKFHLGGRVYFDISWKKYLYSASSKQDVNKWFSYFAQFPLKSPKAIDLIRFKRLILFKERKYHISSVEKYKKRFFNLLHKFKNK